MSSIIKCGPSPSKLAFWVDWKMADIISPLPGCSKRKSGKSISVEEQQIIRNVAKYFQEESKSGNKPQFRAEAGIAKTAAATGVSKNSVRKIVSAGKVIDEGKTRKAKVRFGKLDNFDVGVIRRIIHNLYRENISPSLKKILLQLKEKMNFPYGKMCIYICMYNEKKNTGTQYSLRSIGTVENPTFYCGKVIPGKSNVQNSPCCWNNTRKRKCYKCQYCVKP